MLWFEGGDGQLEKLHRASELLNGDKALVKTLAVGTDLCVPYPITTRSPKTVRLEGGGGGICRSALFGLPTTKRHEVVGNHPVSIERYVI